MARTLRVAAVGDLHCTKGSEGAFQPLFAKVGESADVFVLCGDLTDYGTAEEARVLAKELSGIKVVRVLSDVAGIAARDGTAIETAVPSSTVMPATSLKICTTSTGASPCW